MFYHTGTEICEMRALTLLTSTFQGYHRSKIIKLKIVRLDFSSSNQTLLLLKPTQPVFIYIFQSYLDFGSSYFTKMLLMTPFLSSCVSQFVVPAFFILNILLMLLLMFSCASVLKRVKGRNLSYENELFMQFHFHANQSHFHKIGFALRLALTPRHKGTPKWAITFYPPFGFCIAHQFSVCDFLSKYGKKPFYMQFKG